MAKQKSEQDSGHLERWLDFTQRLYTTLELHEASRIALDAVLQLTGMQRGMLLTLEADRHFLCRYARNREGRTLHSDQFPAVDALLKEVSRDVKSVYRSHHSEPGAVLCAPLVSSLFESNKVIGAIYCDSPEVIPYDERQQERVEVFLMHTSPALESIILYDWATRDSLTNVHLRHYFDAMSQIEWRRTLRHKHPVSVLKVDVDQLKDYNDLYGRKDGDMVLTKTAEILKEVCRTEDLIARYDVDEFAVMLAETDDAGARLVAGRIIEEVPLLLTRDPEKPVTVSIGGASFPRCSVNNIADLVKLADSSLTQAKQSGGHRASIYEPSLSSAHRKIF